MISYNDPNTLEKLEIKEVYIINYISYYFKYQNQNFLSLNVAKTTSSKCGYINFIIITLAI